jgi:hypothetical protein
MVTIIGRDSFSVVSGTMMSSSLIQAFVIRQGMTNIQLGIMNSASNIVPMLATFMLMGVADRIKRNNLVATDRKMVLATAILPVTLITVSLLTRVMTINILFIAIFSSLVLVGLVNSLRPIPHAKIVRNLYVSNIYGSVSGLSGMICHAASIIAGYFAKYLLVRYEGPPGYTLIFSFSLLTLVISALFTGRLKLAKPEDEQKASTVRFPLYYFVQAFKDKYMLSMSVLHIIRGIYSAILFFLLPFGIRHYGLSVESAITITILASVSGLLGYFLILSLYDRIGTIRVMAIATIAFFIAVLGFGLFRTPSAFLFFNMLLSIGITLVGIAVPLGVLKVTPRAFLGIFTGVRMFIMSLSTAIFSTLAGLMIDKVSVLVILSILILLFALQMLFSVFAFAMEGKMESNPA